MEPVTYVPVAGTCDWKPDDEDLCWWQAGSGFEGYMRRHGFVRQGLTWPFWSTAKAGTLLADRKGVTWRHGAVANIVPFLATIPLEQRKLVCLSHGGQVGAIAASQIQCDRLITIGTPVRADLEETYARVSCPWLHVYSTGVENRWQLFGQLFDGFFGVRWQMPAPAENRCIEGIGHSDLLRDPEKHDDVYQREVLPFLRGHQEAATKDIPLPTTGRPSMRSTGGER